MAKNRWNPSSKVNCNHITGMIAKGDAEYKDWVARIFGSNNDTFADLVTEGKTAGYLTAENSNFLLGTSASTPAVKAAAAADAKRSMVIGLLGAGQDTAVDSLIQSGQVDQEFVDSIRAEIVDAEEARRSSK